MPNGEATITHYDTDWQRRIPRVTMPDGEAFTAWLNYDADGLLGGQAKVVKNLP